jgi:hypothetical protein
MGRELISPSRRTHPRHDASTRRRKVAWWHSRKWVDFTIATNDAQPEVLNRISGSALTCRRPWIRGRACLIDRFPPIVFVTVALGTSRCAATVFMMGHSKCPPDPILANDSGIRARVTQPVTDGHEIDARLQKMDGRAVPQAVRVEPLSFETGTCGAGTIAVLGEEIAERSSVYGA